MSCSGRPRDLQMLKTDDAALTNSTDPTVLRSRIEQQSDLIMLLKNHSDAVSKENKRLQAAHRIEEHKALVCHSSERKTKEELAILQDRFETLAAHHEELIVIKDEYKTEKKRLLEKCKGLEVELQIAESRWLATHRDEVVLLHHKLEQQTQQTNTFFEQIVSLQRELESAKKYSQAEGAVSEAATSAMRARCAALERKCLESETSARTRVATLTATITDVNQQCDVLRTTVNARDAEVATTNALLLSETERLNVERKQAERAAVRCEDLEQQLAAVVLENQQLLSRDIDGEIVKLKKEYEAHKKYSRKQLDHEQQVIKRLRMLQDA
eukprot:m.180115 g.180115  ORF g.180115 m.180115 type:complete len:327 (-) comp32005_c0_seq4:242-1222(-)